MGRGEQIIPDGSGERIIPDSDGTEDEWPGSEDTTNERVDDLLDHMLPGVGRIGTEPGPVEDPQAEAQASEFGGGQRGSLGPEGWNTAR